MQTVTSDNLKTAGQIADALDRAASQVNSCAVALAKLGISQSGVQTAMDGVDTVDDKLSRAWTALYDAEQFLRALQAEAA